MIMQRIALYVATYLLVFIPLPNIIQSASAGIGSRLFGMRAFQTFSLIGGLLTWFGIDWVWTAGTGKGMPTFLLISMYLLNALFAKSQKDKMNFVFGSNKRNEIVAIVILLIHHLFFVNNGWF